MYMKNDKKSKKPEAKYPAVKPTSLPVVGENKKNPCKKGGAGFLGGKPANYEKNLI